MASIKLKYVTRDIDRHGNIRYYFRIRGRSKIRLHGQPGSEDFNREYAESLKGTSLERACISASSPKPGSFGHCCLAYYNSLTFKKLDSSTRSWRRRALDQICERLGNAPISRMAPKHVRTLRDEKINMPGAARNRLKALKALSLGPARWTMFPTIRLAA